VFEYHSLIDHVSQMIGSQWGGHELLRSVHIPVDYGADDEFSGFDSKEVMAVAAMDRLARKTQENQDALAMANEANIKRGAEDVEEDTQDVADAPCSFAEGARGDTDGYNACYVCRKLHPTSTSTNQHRGAATPVPVCGLACEQRYLWTQTACLLTTKGPPILAPLAAGAARVRVRLAGGRAK
jgi:hypothetical protein